LIMTNWIFDHAIFRQVLVGGGRIEVSIKLCNRGRRS